MDGHSCLPAQIHRDVCTYNRSQDQSQIGHHCPKENHPDAALGIEQVFDTPRDNNGWDRGQKARNCPANNDTGDRGSNAHNETGNAVECSAEDVELFATKSFRI